VRGNIKIVQKRFPTWSRSSISNNNHYSKVTASKFSLARDPTRGLHGPFAEQLYGLLEPTLAYVHLQWHVPENYIV